MTIDLRDFCICCVRIVNQEDWISDGSFGRKGVPHLWRPQDNINQIYKMAKNYVESTKDCSHYSKFHLIISEDSSVDYKLHKALWALYDEDLINITIK